MTEDVEMTRFGLSPLVKETVDKPAHYQGKGMEVIEVIKAFDLDYLEGNVLKYLLRWKKKGGIIDLERARWYLNSLINDIAKKRMDEVFKQEREEIQTLEKEKLNDFQNYNYETSASGTWTSFNPFDRSR